MRKSVSEKIEKERMILLEQSFEGDRGTATHLVRLACSAIVKCRKENLTQPLLTKSWDFPATKQLQHLSKFFSQFECYLKLAHSKMGACQTLSAGHRAEISYNLSKHQYEVFEAVTVKLELSKTVIKRLW